MTSMRNHLRPGRTIAIALVAAAALLPAGCSDMTPTPPSPEPQPTETAAYPSDVARAYFALALEFTRTAPGFSPPVASRALSPEETHAAFGERLARFESFDAAPLAAASICQVHRARLGGEPVAVKLLYPGIERALTQDFATARRLLRLLAAPLPKVLAEPLQRGRRYLDVLEVEMRRECDLEAEGATL